MTKMFVEGLFIGIGLGAFVVGAVYIWKTLTYKEKKLKEETAKKGHFTEKKCVAALAKLTKKISVCVCEVCKGNDWTLGSEAVFVRCAYEHNYGYTNVLLSCSTCGNSKMMDAYVFQEFIGMKLIKEEDGVE